MKLVVVIPSADYARNAGARIRYGRLAEGLAERGFAFSMQPLASFEVATADCDVVIYSKCIDPRAIVGAHVLSRRGIAVGIDVFDDYFSQVADSRLNRSRWWFSEMLAACDFALASTTMTADLVRQAAPALPVHVLNDPAPDFDPADLAQRLRAKRSQAIADGRLKVVWFGMGDNPHFAMGLHDLAAFGPTLSMLSHSLAVDLVILTNRRSLDAAGLERIAGLPVKATVEIWSEEREAELLADALVAFLPVNASRFSRAKSLNRAITALSAGCQLLSVGDPLYAPLEPLIYRDEAELRRHLREDSLRLAPKTLDTLLERLAEIASAPAEVERLTGFLAKREKRRERPSSERADICLVHGLETTLAAHNLVQSVGGISVASPFCAAPFDFDAMVEMHSDGTLGLIVAPAALSRLAPAVRKAMSRSVRVDGRKYWQTASAPPPTQDSDMLHGKPLPLAIALYPAVMDAALELVRDSFGAEFIVTSEQSMLPLDYSGHVHA